MQMSVKKIPAGYHTITPYIAVMGAPKLIDFLKRAFGAEVTALSEGDGRVHNAEIRIGDSMLMASDARDDKSVFKAMLYLYVENVDAWFERAVKAGAQVLVPPTDMFYGDRSCG